MPQQTTTYTNPLLPGFNPDPSIIHHAESGYFYLITSTFHLYPGLPIYASRDLKTWTHIGNAINRPQQLSLQKAHMVAMPLDTVKKMVGAGGLFAPTIRFVRGGFALFVRMRLLMRVGRAIRARKASTCEISSFKQMISGLGSGVIPSTLISTG
jgi:hypothetical protein